MIEDERRSAIQTRHALLVIGALLTLASAGAATAQDADDPGARREELARLAYIDAETSLAAGLSQPELVYQWSRRWLEAKAANDPAGKPAALAEHLERMRALKTKAEAMIASGMWIPTQGTAVDFYVAEAEFWGGGAEGDAG